MKIIERNWKNYLRRNSETFSGMDCSLVTAVNAYYFLTGRTIEQGTQRYLELRKLCGAMYGSAMNMKPVWKELGIKPTKTFSMYPDFDTLEEDLPLEASVWHKSTGFHSVLIVEYEPRTKSFRIPNFRYATNLEGWIYEEDFQHFTRKNPDLEEPRHMYRRFERSK